MPTASIIIWYVTVDGGDWRRLGQVVADRRVQLGLTQNDVQARGGPSMGTMRLIEGGLRDSYRPVVLARLETALGWAAGSVRAVLAGGQPRGDGERERHDSAPGELGQLRGLLAAIAGIVESKTSDFDKVRFIRLMIADKYQPHGRSDHVEQPNDHAS